MRLELSACGACQRTQVRVRRVLAFLTVTELVLFCHSCLQTYTAFLHDSCNGTSGVGKCMQAVGLQKKWSGVPVPECACKQSCFN